MQNKYKQLSKKLIRYSMYGIIVQCVLLASAFASAASKEKNKSVQSVTTDAQRQEITVTGTVTSSEDGSGLPGVNILIKGTTQGTTTDIDGKYTIQVPDGNTVLIFSFIGYIPEEIAVSSRSVINVSMVPDIQQLNEIVVVGYGTQKKVTLTGAVSNIEGADLLQTKNANPQNMITGRIAGVRVWQKSSEPGTYNNAFDIRGFEGGGPLVVIDGVPRTMADFQRLNPVDIDDISVLKDASAAIYGARGASGVILVTTKKGKEGETTISYNGSYTLQSPAGFPGLADPYETMTIYNEQAMNNVNGGNIIFDEEDFAAYREGTRQAADWNSLLISDFSPQTQHDISISGGTEKTQYYVSGGYLFQEGIFKSGDLNYKKYNLRSNITSELAKGLTFNLNLSGMADERNNPYSSTTDIIKNYWAQGVLFPAYADPEKTMLNYEGLELERNTIAMMRSDVSGYRQYKQTNIQSSASLDFDFGTVANALEGLSVKALVGYDYRNDNNTAFRREYYQYAYDPVTDSYISKLFNESSPSQLRRELFAKQQWLGQFLLNYNRTFGNHEVTGLLGWESQKQKGDNFYAQRNLAFAMDYLFAGVNQGMISGMSSSPDDLYTITNAAVVGRLNYIYGDRYIIEGQFRYDGSSKFVEDNQWGFFPSVSAGWRLSEEPFFKSISALSFIDQLKFRASYGETSDDGDLQYTWYPGYIYPETGDNADDGYYAQYAPGYVFGGEFINGASLIVPNRKITWWTAKTFNVGVDFEAWNGLFGFSLDYFNRERVNLHDYREGEVPTVIGTGAPRENVNSDRQFGMDLALSHRNAVGEFSYGIKAIATVTRREWLVAVQKGPWGNSYDRWKNDNLNNRYQGVQFGYEKAGRYESWEDIWSYPIYKERDILPGDYKYEDWNGDGEINGLDEHPFAFDQTPWLNFSLAFDGSYRNFDLSLLFQGTAMGSMEYKEPLYNIWGINGGGTLEQYTDRWHPVDPLADPYDPETEWVSGHYGYTGNYPRGNSEFNRVSTAYLRLKSIELGYTLPNLKALPSSKVRVFANAYNIFTLTGVKFVDPEHPDSDNGRLYPLNKTYTVGLSATF